MTRKLIWLAVGFVVAVGAVFYFRAAAAIAAVGRIQPATQRVWVRGLKDDGSLGEVVKMNKVIKTDQEWRSLLTDEQYRISREKGTERAFCSLLNDNMEPGLYVCVACGLPLFSSRAKFHSGTGWPSFFEAVGGSSVVTNADESDGMVRNEILCARCDSHLGHVFNDGPPPTGLRFCLNSAALVFVPDSDYSLKGNDGKPREKATFAMGCFWGVESVFREVKGVKNVVVGYIGGHEPWPSYEDVCTHESGHAEAVQMIYDPAEVTFEELLDVFWANHNPTTRNRQGGDIGSQYRSAIFYHSAAQEKAASKSRSDLERNRTFGAPIVSEITAAPAFYRAEEYHQGWHKKHGGPACSVKSLK